MRSQHNKLITSLIACALSASPLLGCDGEDDSGTQAGVSAGGAPVEGGAEPNEAGESSDEGGAEPNEAGESGGEVQMRGGEEPPATVGGAEGNTAGGVDEIVIDVAGSDEGMYDPIDESVPGEGMHGFTMTDINGEEVDMRRYRNRVALVVNVASRCGYTRQYEGLQALYEQYKDQGLVILGFPANNFGSQEPGTDEEISEFCEANFGVTFPLFSKISVKGGDMHPLYGYLTGESGREVSWNFNKFLVGPDGLYREHYLSGTEPDSEELISAIEAQLATLGD